jgi:hypothetical protein
MNRVGSAIICILLAVALTYRWLPATSTAPAVRKVDGDFLLLDTGDLALVFRTDVDFVDLHRPNRGKGRIKLAKLSAVQQGPYVLIAGPSLEVRVYDAECSTRLLRLLESRGAS